MGGTITRPAEVLGNLRILIKQASKAIGQAVCPMPKMSFGMHIRGKGTSPKCKLKASKGRQLLPCIVYMLRTYFKCDTPHRRLRLACLSALNAVYNHMYEWTADDNRSVHVAKAAREHCILYAELSVRSLQATGNPLYWRLKPKHHLFVTCMLKPAANRRESER